MRDTRSEHSLAGRPTSIVIAASSIAAPKKAPGTIYSYIYRHEQRRCMVRGWRDCTLFLPAFLLPISRVTQASDGDDFRPRTRALCALHTDTYARRCGYCPVMSERAISRFREYSKSPGAGVRDQLSNCLANTNTKVLSCSGKLFPVRPSVRPSSTDWQGVPPAAIAAFQDGLSCCSHFRANLQRRPPAQTRSLPSRHGVEK